MKEYFIKYILATPLGAAFEVPMYSKDGSWSFIRVKNREEGIYIDDVLKYRRENYV